MHYKIPVVFRVTKQGQFRGSLDMVYANVKDDGFYCADYGSAYDNGWYLNSTRLATPEEYADKLKAMNALSFGGDTWEFIPMKKRNFS